MKGLPQGAALPTHNDDQSRRNRYLSPWDYGSRSLFGLAVLFVIEGLMFYTQLVDQILPYFPRAFDQTSYSVATYQLIERFRNDGWQAFLHLTNPPATGVTFIIQGALLSLIGGANRGAFLSLNLIYFIALQVCLFVTVRSRTNSVALAWVGIAILLSARTHFSFQGNLYDYRIDYSALCLYGIWCCFLLSSHAFRNRDATIGVVIAGVLLVLERFFTILYIGTVLGALFLATLPALYFAKTPEHRTEAARTAKNLFLCGAFTALTTLPFLFKARHAIFSYYVVGHVLSSEKYIRAAESRVSTFFDEVTYYPWSLGAHHLGSQMLAFGAVVLAGMIFAYFFIEGGQARGAVGRLRGMGFDLLALALAIVVPLTLLTFDLSKSPVVGGVVTVPCILLFILIASVFTSSHSLPGQSLATNRTKVQQMGRYVHSSLTVGCVVVAMAIFLANGTASQHNLSRSDLVRVNNVNKAIASYIIDHAIANPSISFDRIDEYLNAGTIQVYGYEVWRRFIDIVPKTHGMFAIPRDKAMKLVQDSDIVVLSDPVLGREFSHYPMDTKIREYWSDLRQWTEANLALLYTTNINGIPFRVFHKPIAKSEGGSGDWITSRGLTFTLNRSELQRWPFLILDGEYDNFIGDKPGARALATSENEPFIELPVRFETSGTQYHLVVDARGAAGSSGVTRIQLTFDRYFVPKGRGINEDTRELVIRLPTTEALRANE
jgi:hypothetical protein